MKKEEYIAKYGEEKYQELKKKMREYHQTHKEQIHKRKRKNYNGDKEKVKIANKIWRDSNPDKKRAQVLKWQNKYPQKAKAKNLMGMYKIHDKERGFDINNNVSSKWILENIFSGQSCIYCGDQDWIHLGCDRIDNSKPHTPDNVVCACFICNAERSDRHSVEEFKEYRALHPRACDIPKGPVIELGNNNAIKKQVIQIG